ncbi:MAG: hypothetical protein NTV34_17435 [Proteobacteria bacterium]|nr:hypothetical protein [Pseudomonadota bacterium]
MKLLFSCLVFLGVSGGTFAATQHGSVLCDLNSPKVKGFELIQLRDLNRTFTGSHDVDGLRVTGEYFPTGEALTISVNLFDEDTLEKGEFVVETTTHVSGTDYVKLVLPLPQAYKGENKRFELYCRLSWSK